MPDSDENGRGRWIDSRTILTMVMSLGGLGLIAYLGHIVLAVGSSDPKSSEENAKYVFASIVPLIASWIGTIMAYYFSKDNFAAATQSVATLTKSLTERLASVAAKDKMRPLAQITVTRLTPAQDATYTLAQFSIDFAKVDRGVILSAGDVLRYIIHKAMVEKYLLSITLGTHAAPAGKAAGAITLADMLGDDAQIKQYSTLAGFVSQDATLADAKSRMDSITNCQDVFVTKTGSKDEPILGWITDNKIAANSKVS